jgi:hypothetical protein
LVGTLLLPVRASPEEYDLVERSEWLLEDLGGNDGFSRLVVRDVDGDGTNEVIVVGYAAGAGSQPDAYVGVYRLDGRAWVREAAYTKDFRGGFDALNGVAVLDYDGDNADEIVVTGYGTNAHDTNTDVDIVVGILRKSGSSLIEEVGWYTKDFAGSGGRKNYGLDVAVGNVDQDGSTELVVVSRDDFGPYVDTPMRIGVLSVQGEQIEEETWFTENPTGQLDYWSQVEIADIDGDGNSEIVTAGSYNVFWSSIAVAAYVKGDGALSRESNLYTKRIGSQNNHGGGLAIGSVDGDAALEAVVVGNFDDNQVNSDGADLALGVLRYDGSAFAEDAPWLHEDVGKACAGTTYSGSDYWSGVAIGDVDDDGTTEIVIGGRATGDCTDYDIVAGAFSIAGGVLTKEIDWYWKDMDEGFDIGIDAVVGNLDGDNALEVALCGYHRADAGSDGDGVAVVVEAGIKPGTWAEVVDEDGGALQGASVYLKHWDGSDWVESLAGTTGADGRLWVDAATVGDQLAATHRVLQHTGTKGQHDNWSYRVHLTSIDIDADGNTTLHTIATAAELAQTQTLTVKEDNTLIGFNILASVEFDADSAYVSALGQGLREASEYLYDATDGQMFFEKVTICDRSQRWSDADYHFKASTEVRPWTNRGAIDTTSKYVHMGRYWGRRPGTRWLWSRTGPWTGRYGYRTVVHELGHYGLYLGDEYYYYGGLLGTEKKDAQCTANRTVTTSVYYDDALASSLMDSQFGTSEFCSTLAANPHNPPTDQGDKSCWETIDEKYSDTQAPARWNILRPDTDRGQVVRGPNSLPFASVLTSVDTSSCTGDRTDRCQDEDWTFTHDGSPLADVEIYLKQSGGKSIYQGKTDADGKLFIMGGAKGDRVDGSTYTTSQECVLGQCVGVPVRVTIDAEVDCSGQGQLRPAAAGRALEMEPVPFDLSVTTRPGTVADALDVSAIVTATLSSLPQARVTQAGAAAPITIDLSYSPADQAYVGTVSLDNRYDREGVVDVVAEDGAGQSVTALARFQLQEVSPEESLTVYSADGNAELYVPAGSLPEGTQLGIALDGSGAPVTGTSTLVAGPYSIAATGGVTELITETSLTLRYDALGASGVDTAMLSIYWWDEATEAWLDQGSEHWPDHQLVVTLVDGLGTYALFGIDNVPPESQVESLPACGPHAPFEVRWSGTDTGTGVAAYDVQVKDGADGAWTDWITNTRQVAGTFSGELWHTYGFRSRARDWAGNQEPYPAEADARTMIGCRLYLPMVMRGD